MGFNGIGMTELIIVLVIALIVLGPKRLPEAGRSLGRGMREFKDSLSGGSKHDDDDDEYTEIAAVPATAKKTSEPSTPVSQ
jgi:sec-independent protein translocase protein TatA